jgi:hypothetical protein
MKAVQALSFIVVLLTCSADIVQAQDNSKCSCHDALSYLNVPADEDVLTPATGQVQKEKAPSRAGLFL